MPPRIVVAVLLLWGTQGVLAGEPSTEEQRLLHQKMAELDRLQAEITELRESAGTPVQIRVDVEMLEVNLTKMREMGISTEWFATGHITTEVVKRVVKGISNADSQSGNFNDNLQIVDRLQKQNLAKSLASPSVVVLSGKPATFHVGGSFPIPTSGESGERVAFRNYGTELEMYAIALGDKQVRLEYVSRVSTINLSRSIEIDGIQVPPMHVLEVESGCELSLGETAITAGLVQKRVEAIERADGQVTENTVDVGLMVVVTPELVGPADTPSAEARHAVQEAAYR